MAIENLILTVTINIRKLWQVSKKEFSLIDRQYNINIHINSTSPNLLISIKLDFINVYFIHIQQVFLWLPRTTCSFILNRINLLGGKDSRISPESIKSDCQARLSQPLELILMKSSHIDFSLMMIFSQAMVEKIHFEICIKNSLFIAHLKLVCRD